MFPYRPLLAIVCLLLVLGSSLAYYSVINYNIAVYKNSWQRRAYYYDIGNHKEKREKKRQLKSKYPDRHICLTLPVTYPVNFEIYYQGKLYDVEYRQQAGDSITYHLWHDAEEQAYLEKETNSFAPSKSSSKTPLSHQGQTRVFLPDMLWVDAFFSGYNCFKPIKYPDDLNQITCFSGFFLKELSRAQTPPSPPPENIS
ncbi:MAG: hypothetical protein IPN25_11220 [Sphingobacteriales bacterium]|nr:hypothetical protein [Sphingobacteriales bacterium]MBL0246916.1 hypothetical protein [Sphingobacteriales bacterium]MBP9140578.1 hypothetical protein [Chitinophagales bacterium]